MSGDDVKLFVWERVDQLTTNWHPEGGLVIIAESLDAARELIKDRVKCGALTKDPDYTTSVYGKEEKVFIFPDAGCC